MFQLPNICQINRTAWERCIQTLQQPEVSDNVSLKPILLLMDDNFYYSSMRYEVYQLARKCKPNTLLSAQAYISQSKIIHLKSFFQIHLASVRCICTVIWNYVLAEMREGLSLFWPRLYGRWRCGWTPQILRKTYGKITVFHSCPWMFFPKMTCKPSQ